ncbi:hypothetical protein [Mesorhizobium sp. SP-1A]|nr:hypothetical protein [Mesorhizobium sp. SP-1A]
MSKKQNQETIVFYKSPFKRGVDDVYTLAPLRSALKSLFAGIFTRKDNRK